MQIMDDDDYISFAEKGNTNLCLYTNVIF